MKPQYPSDSSVTFPLPFPLSFYVFVAVAVAVVFFFFWLFLINVFNSHYPSIHPPIHSSNYKTITHLFFVCFFLSE